MRFHIPAIVGQPTVKSNSVCAYTQKILKFADMMMPRGHEVFIYSGPEYDGQCTEHFDVYGDAPYDTGWDIAKWEPHNLRASEVINENFEDGDYLLLISGIAQKTVADRLYPKHFRVIEFGIGYQGVFADYRVFESYAWMHTVLGEIRGAYTANGSFYDTVIPNYFDASDFEDFGGRGDYFLYTGRLLERKGVHIASEVCEKLGVDLKIAGEGDFRPEYGEYVGKVGPEERKELMGNAIASFVPTLYLEPFGGVVVESMLSGTPVLSTDWGAFTETVHNGENGYRCKTFGDFLVGAEKTKDLDRKLIRKYAKQFYSLEAIAPQYESFFNQVNDLQDKGWYTETSYNFGQ